jgi:hypothetical protein
MVWIDQKDEEEYTGIESYICEKIKSREIKWLPINE